MGYSVSQLAKQGREIEELQEEAQAIYDRHDTDEWHELPKLEQQKLERISKRIEEIRNLNPLRR